MIKNKSRITKITNTVDTNQYRPIKNVKSLIKPGVVKLSKSEYRFLKLMNSLRDKMSEDKIISFYAENVQRHYGKYELIKKEWVEIKYTPEQIKRNALFWFDYNLGKMIRKKILSDSGNLILSELMQLR